ncbi:MAG: hypothetical protein EXS47_01265 [Candidatus Zambryskibacteria bacterium]|nr:hypothetical protein [Candidatus Zambryskibacteria bacterium]
MGHKKAFVAVVVSFVLSFSVACGRSDAQVEKEVKDVAIAMSSATISGPEAEMKRQQIFKVLRVEEMSLGQVHLEQADMDNHVRLAYERDARKSLVNLRNQKASPEQAKMIYDQFTSELRNAQKSFGDLGTTELAARQNLSRNALEFIQSTGGKPTVAQYQAAGLTVPTIVKTRTVYRRIQAPAPRSVKASKPAQKKPAVKPRLNGK